MSVIAPEYGNTLTLSTINYVLGEKPVDPQPSARTVVNLPPGLASPLIPVIGRQIMVLNGQ